jgi:hypothetical protein
MAMTVQPPTEDLTIHHKVDDYPTWRKGYDESEKSRVAASIAIGKAFRDANDLMERMIREHAYQLWDRAGRPEGRSEEYWFAAKAECERKEATRERKPVAPVRRSADVRCETAADWGKRGRDPTF